MSNFSKHLQNDSIEDVLVVIGNKCQIYPIDDDTLKAEMLSPWMNDKSILIDKYDARSWLSDLSNFDGFQSDLSTEDEELEKECDRERYFDLDEKLDKLEQVEDGTDRDSNDGDVDTATTNRSGIYSSVQYSYETTEEPKQENDEDSADHENEDIPYQLPPDLIIPDNIILPKTEKQAAKIEKTATFIAAHGIQMEILLKTKQGNNKKFHFLTFDDELNPFYKFLLDKIKNAEYVPAKRQLFHLTKTDTSECPSQDTCLSLPKVDISNTAYYKLINKYRSADNNGRTDSQANDKSVDGDHSLMITDKKEPNGCSSPNEAEDEKEKLYKALYEQYYTYYYNYYYQLHNNSPMLQESNQLQIQEDSKSLAINAAAYAAKAAVEQFQKEQEEITRIDKLKRENIERKKQLCITIKYVDYVMKHGSEFEYAVMSKSDKLKFLEPDNQYHSFYQHCLSRAKKANNKSTDNQLTESQTKVNHFPKWEDYIKKTPSANIQSAPKLIVESPKSKIISNPTEQRLVTITDHISSLISAEEIGRSSYKFQQQQPANITPSSYVKANRKRKATEFLEKINQKKLNKKLPNEISENSHLKSSVKRSKPRKSK